MDLAGRSGQVGGIATAGAPLAPRRGLDALWWCAARRRQLPAVARQRPRPHPLSLRASRDVAARLSPATASARGGGDRAVSQLSPHLSAGTPGRLAGSGDGPEPGPGVPTAPVGDVRLAWAAHAPREHSGSG